MSCLTRITGGGPAISDLVGTPLYKAFELSEDKDYDGKIDVYSFALILYSIVSGLPAFSVALLPVQLSRKVNTGERTNIPATVEPCMDELIRAGWSEDEAKRPSFNDIFEELRRHEFCVSRDGFDARAVASYVQWISGSRRPE
jgi:serine/threonine protein kinase